MFKGKRVVFHERDKRVEIGSKFKVLVAEGTLRGTDIFESFNDFGFAFFTDTFEFERRIEERVNPPRQCDNDSQQKHLEKKFFHLMELVFKFVYG